MIYKTIPQYPVIAKSVGMQGTVVLQATISKSGTIEDLQVISGPQMLQQAAIDAVKTWRYRPYLLNDQPIEVETTVNVIFKLDARSQVEVSLFAQAHPTRCACDSRAVADSAIVRLRIPHVLPLLGPIGDNRICMRNLSRRDFLMSASAATLAAVATKGSSSSRAQRVFVASGTPEGIRSFDWNPATGELTAAGVAANVTTVDWICFSHDRKYLFAACEVDSFNGKPTGEVASFRLDNGELEQLSAQNSASIGTCHVAVDHTGQMLLAADYGGGSAASFQITDGQLSEPVWSEHYTDPRPQPRPAEDRPRTFCVILSRQSFRLYQRPGRRLHPHLQPDPATAAMKPAGAYHGAAGLRSAHAALSSQRTHRILHE